MSKELIDRLRIVGGVGNEAADTIERLERELDAERNRRFEGNRIASEEYAQVSRQRDELLSACETFMSHGACEVSYYAIRNAIAHVKESK